MSAVAELFPAAPSMSIEAIDKADANRLFVAWGHPLGACERPFGQEFHVMLAKGRAVAATATTSTVSSTLTDEKGKRWGRKQMVELARIARSPEDRWAMRPMLRLWREVLVNEWVHWPVQLAASYALPGTSGDIYRFDGWTKVRTVKKSSPGKGSTWAKPSATDTIGNGIKTLWIYRYLAHGQEAEIGSTRNLDSAPSNPSSSGADIGRST